MNIKINDFTIQEGNQSIYIDVEANEDCLVTDIFLWRGEDYKNWNKAISLHPFLENVNNTEKIIVTAEDLEIIGGFNGIWIIEAYTDCEPEDPCEANCKVAVGVTYDITKYYNCLIQYLLDSDIISDCQTCPKSKNENILETILLIFNSIKPLMDTCLYQEASVLINKLEKLCNFKKCHNCEQVVSGCTSCKGFTQL